MSGLQKPHVVMVPIPALGHLIPFLDLAKLLASNGLAISYVTTPANVALLRDYLDIQALNDIQLDLVALPTPAVEGLQGRERYDLFPLESRSLIVEMVEKLQQPFNNWMEEQFHQQKVTPPVCIVRDLIIAWAEDTAQKFNVSSVLFSTCGAFAVSLLHSISCSILQNALEKDGEDSLEVSFNLPRPVKLSKHEVSPVFLNPDLSNPHQRFICQRFQEMGKGSGILINTFHEIETFYVQHLKNLTAKPVWAIGPVYQQNLSGGSGNVNGRGKMVSIDGQELVCWLDSHSPRSVVYVSFGSHTILSEEQTHALARGLEASEQPFVWVIKMEPASSESNTDLNSTYLPEGFLERTKERGLIIRGWAPQLVILSHISVGAFISHCGWNSVLESVCLGVPILAWSMVGDQHFNSKLFAELGVGIQLCEHADGIPNEERVKEAVIMALTGDKGEEMRERAEKLKETATNAIEQKGSSAIDLRAFVTDMYKLNTRSTEHREKQNRIS
ncbi:hypothetical protein SUGI_0073870 [Cryptomeria japonica]|uniref:scopoletin glucosyltransferase n=1 Tax=Cryptomeria japonica TaxID=3369 RepID=UPI002408E083|nr:scopoletin glucosyltransferase [Cryptomeria japonica]XP_057847167.2 scopoletin glucosyltransferase [Cryptomeria japonica]GLJ07772.1 hypothetical protein SUGI_0073870 [Cryptomeria japonica]